MLRGIDLFGRSDLELKSVVDKIFDRDLLYQYVVYAYQDLKVYNVSSGETIRDKDLLDTYIFGVGVLVGRLCITEEEMLINKSW